MRESAVLSPEVVAAVDDLEVAARLIVEGMRAGGHRSPFHGYNAEFQQHRPYRVGDDLKYLDWKVLARTDRMYSRQFRETTSMSVMLVLDASASMGYDAGGVSKFRYAVVMAAALAYLLVTQGDAVGLLASGGGATDDTDAGRLTYLPARGGRTHLRSLFAHLERIEPGGVWDPARVVARAAELLKRRGVILVLSDFYDAEEDTRRELRRAVSRGHDAALLHILSPAELALPRKGVVAYRDVETGEERIVDSNVAAAEYRDAVREFVTRCERSARRDGIAYARARTDEPPGVALRTFLLGRNAPVGGVQQ